MRNHFVFSKIKKFNKVTSFLIFFFHQFHVEVLGLDLGFDPKTQKRKGHARWIEQYYWGTQQIVNGWNCPFAIPSSGRTYFLKKFRKTSFRTTFGRRRWASRRTPGMRSERTCFELIPEEDSSGRPPSSYGRTFFRKCFCKWFF